MDGITEYCYDVVVENTSNNGNSHDRLFDDLQEAVEYCVYHGLSKEIIRKYERAEKYDEEYEDELLVWDFQNGEYVY